MIFALLALVAVGLSIIYYSVSLTQSAETEIQGLANFPEGSMVTISGEISKIFTSKSGNIYLTVDDGTGSITVPLLGSVADSYRNVSENSFIVVTGLTDVYNNELEVMPKEIEVS